MAGAVDGRGPVWFKSSYSNGAGGECVECALVEDLTHVRDSKSAKGLVVPVVTIRDGAWCSFLQALKRGELV